MLQPKKTKYKKSHRVSYDGKPKRGTTVAFGEYGLKALQGNYVTSRQIEATRVAITRFLKRNGKVWIRIFPSLPRTKKPLEVRMGKGKGSVDHYAAVVKAGMIMFEVGEVNQEEAVEALRLGMHKLPVKCKIVKRGEENK